MGREMRFFFLSLLRIAILALCLSLFFSFSPSAQHGPSLLSGVICELFPDIVSQENVLPSALGALDLGLQKEPRVANNACHVS